MTKGMAAAIIAFAMASSHHATIQTAKEMKIVYEQEQKQAEIESARFEEPKGGHLTRSGGVYYFGGHKETWYSTKERSGQSTAVPIPGKHADNNGIIRDSDGYVCVASSDHRIYSIVETSWGPAKVYDTGCRHGTVDIYTTW